MNRLGGFLLLSAVFGFGQTQSAPAGTQSTTVAQQGRIVSSNPAQAMTSPSPIQLYCAGFITREPIREEIHVVGGKLSPEVAHFATNDLIYLTGAELKEGDVYSLLRRVKDPNEYEAFAGQRRMLARLGDIYAEIGQAKVLSIHGNIALAKIQLSCTDTVPGDIAVPFVEKQSPPFRSGNFDMYAPSNGKTIGRIILAKDFDDYLGFANVAYLNIGSNNGIKVGDYLRSTRTYDAIQQDPAESLSYKANITDDTIKSSYRFNLKQRAKDLPRRSLGEMIVIGVTPTTSTVLITRSLEDIHVGDGVELEEELPLVATPVELVPSQTTPGAIPLQPGVEQPAPTGPQGAPTIYCSANPATVRAGESSTINCNASSPTGQAVTIKFSSAAGQLAPRMNVATLDTTGLPPGPVAVAATATDEAGLSASTTTTVTVEAVPTTPPVPSKGTELQFKPDSVYVNNLAKAVLDDVALHLQRDPTATAFLVGFTAPGENLQIGLQRAENARTYLSKTKGIDPSRIQTKAATEQKGNIVEVWVLPAGATPPEE